jgi:hypothetical protein
VRCLKINGHSHQPVLCLITFGYVHRFPIRISPSSGIWHNENLYIVTKVSEGRTAFYFNGVVYKARQTIYVRRNIEALLQNHHCRGKAISITYYKCVSVASFILHAKRMCRIILSPMTSPAVPQFSTLSHKVYDFREKVIQHKICVLIFSTTFVWNIYHFKKIKRDAVTNLHTALCKTTVDMTRF